MILETKNLICGYTGEFQTVPLSLEVQAGEKLGFVGPNGSGKSTLFQTLLGFLPPLQGSYSWAKKYRIGYLPQVAQVSFQLPITVQEVLGTACSDPLQEIEKMGDPLKILSLIHDSFRRLSGGQKQRVLLSRTFLYQPEILFLDEPNNHLDSATRKLFWNFISKVDRILAVFVIDHHPASLENCVDRMIPFEEV